MIGFLTRGLWGLNEMLCVLGLAWSTGGAQPLANSRNWILGRIWQGTDSRPSHGQEAAEPTGQYWCPLTHPEQSPEAVSSEAVSCFHPSPDRAPLH